MITDRKMATRSIQNKVDINAKATEETVYLYEDIGGYWGVEHQEWVKDFNAIDASTIHLRIDSGGGDVFAARAMKTAIMQHKAKVIAHIDGLAASAASFLAMGADEVEIVDGGFIMIHKALSFMDIFGYYNDEDLERLVTTISKEKELHGKINESIANDYAKKTEGTKDEYLALMAAETWFTADEALEQGLVDRVYDGDPVEGSYDLSTFKNTPDTIKNRDDSVSKRTLEKALRDAGLSNKEAKRVIAEGFDGELRDDATPIVPEPVIPTPDETQRDAVPAEDEKDKVIDLLTRVAAIAH